MNFFSLLSLSIEKNNNVALFRFQVTSLDKFDDAVGLGPVSRDPDPKDQNFGVTSKFARYGLHRSIKKIINDLEFGSRKLEILEDSCQIADIQALNRPALCARPYPMRSAPGPMPRN